MNRTQPHGPNRDEGARLYEDLPSVTDRGDRTSAYDDSFRATSIDGQQASRDGDDLSADETRALDRSARDALHPSRRTGPKNATRSDALIVEELSERFRDDELLDASEILLRSEDGRVLLTGDVPERWMKHRAEDIADAVRGVAGVENRIRVDDGKASFGTGGAVRSGDVDSTAGSGFSSGSPNRERESVNPSRL